MTRYFFDIRDGCDLYPDDIGQDLADEKAAEIEATQSLAGMIKDDLAEDRRDMAIEVRTEEGPVFQAAFIFGNGRMKH